MKLSHLIPSMYDRECDTCSGCRTSWTMCPPTRNPNMTTTNRRRYCDHERQNTQRKVPSQGTQSQQPPLNFVIFRLPFPSCSPLFRLSQSPPPPPPHSFYISSLTHQHHLKHGCLHICKSIWVSVSCMGKLGRQYLTLNHLLRLRDDGVRRSPSFTRIIL